MNLGLWRTFETRDVKPGVIKFKCNLNPRD